MTELAFAGLARQAALVRDGEFKPLELVDLCLERIGRLDPALNAFRVVFADRARAEAKRAGRRRRTGGEPPLHGVPVAVKDNLDVAGEVTAQGSNALDAPAAADSEIVRRLRAAGAIVIGKTHMSELAIFPFTETAAWGMTRNPWDRTCSAGGSSGCPSEAYAAPTSPASVTGLFGLKPQRGRVTLMPYPEHWHGLSAAGAVTRTVRDTAVWLDAVSGPAPGDLDAARQPERSFVDAASSEPGRLRVALSFKPTALTKVDDRVRAAVERVAEALRSLGHRVTEHDPDYGELAPLFFPRWLAGIHDDVRSIPHPERLEKRTRQLARLGALVGDSGVRRARAAEPARSRRINALFDDHDVLLTPTLPAPPDALGRFEGRSLAAALFLAGQMVGFTQQWNLTGQPAASIPAPTVDDVPIGAQLVGRPHDEGTLLSLSAQLERELGWPDRIPPGL